MSIEELLAGESQYVEYKVSRPGNAKSYLKTVVAFSNARGGTIVFGVDDKTHEVKGIPGDDVFVEMDAIANAIADSVEPAVFPEISLQDVDGKSLILVEVPLGKRCPYFIKSEGPEHGVYVRVGATSRPADWEWVRQLTIDSVPGGYDHAYRRGTAVSEEEIEKLCDLLYQTALAHCGEDERESLRKVTRSQLLSWGVLCERDDEILPANSFFILRGDAGYVPPVQCGLFRGKTRSVFVDRREVAGTPMEQIEGAYQYVLAKINMAADLNYGIARHDVYELPLWPVRELITNAVLHRSYMDTSSVQVAIFDDRLEVTAPGGIVRGLSLQKILEGRSAPRNEGLAQAFRYMRLIEGWGSGIPRVVSECLEFGLRVPEFVDMGDALRVNVWRLSADEFGARFVSAESKAAAQTDGDKPAIDRRYTGDKPAIDRRWTGDSVESEDNPRWSIGTQPSKLLGLLETKEAITAQDAMGLLGVKQSRAREVLADMVDAGLLQKHGDKRYTYYTLPEGR